MPAPDPFPLTPFRAMIQKSSVDTAFAEVAIDGISPTITATTTHGRADQVPIIKRDYVEFRAGDSSKFYRLTMSETGGKFTVMAEWGRIGTAGQSGAKVAGVTREAAELAHARTIGEKTGKGYQPANDPQGGSVGGSSPAPKATPVARADDPKMPYIPAQMAGARGDLRSALASPGKYAIEEKFDGFRGLLRILDGKVTLLNRAGMEKGRTENVPALVAAATAWANADKTRWTGTLLDGELVGSSWSNTAHLLGGAGKTNGGLRFVCFDVPYLAGRDLRNAPWSERRVILEKALAGARSPIEVAVILRPTADVVEAIWLRGGEGVILKNRTAPYRSGDRTAWTKIKQESTAEGVILGADPGKGKYSATTGAVRIGMFKGGVMTHVTSISGMTDEVRRAIGTAPGTRVGDVVEFTFNEKTADSFRHPRWLRPRPDKQAKDCRWEDA